jgi:hypothetical protein
MGIQENIEQLWINNQNPNINSIMLSRKIVNNEQTNELSITYNVNIKKPIEELSSEEIIPKTLIIDYEKYRTDVVENSSKVEALTCFTNYSSNPEILKLQGNPSLQIPLKGGQEIIQFPTNWISVGGGGYAVNLGTLGFFAIDNEDDRVVGVTNSHVLCKNFLTNTQQDFTSPYNLYEQITWPVDAKAYRPGAISRAGGALLIVSNILKRYFPIVKPGWGGIDNINYIDACLTNIDNNLNPSSSIHIPSSVTRDTSYMPFATTNEIDNLLLTNPFIYSTGRTTGPKGWGNSSSCRLIVDALFVSINVFFDSSTSVPYSDVIRFRYEDSSNFPIAGGDSGSVVFAEINGTLKIIGLAFAGNGGSFGSPSPGVHFGYMCRIDRVASMMNIRAWEASTVINTSTPSVTLYSKPFTNRSRNDSIIIDNKKYYNIGLSNSNIEDIINPPPSPTPTPTQTSVTPTPTLTSTVTPTITPTNTLTQTVTKTVTPSMTPNINGNTANYKSLANWNGTFNGNITTVGSNGRSSYYGTYDQSGLVMEHNHLTGSGDLFDNGFRGGSYASSSVSSISSSFRIKNQPFSKARGESFRICTSINPLNLPNFVSVGNPNNTNDTTGYGSVSYNYMIGRYLVTNCEYALFLNSIAVISDPYNTYYSDINDNNINWGIGPGINPYGGIERFGTAGSYYYNIRPNMANKPVLFVSWLEIARYCNWLHNGKPTGIQNNSTTEAGAYNINGATSRVPIVAKNANAKYWLPTENEWYKAAYYTPNKNGTGPGYWQYATQSDTDPVAITANVSGDGILNGQTPIISDYSC